MAEIISKPATKAYRDNFDRIFKKIKPKGMVGFVQTSLPKEVVQESIDKMWIPDENVDCGEFNTPICCTDDPNFGG